MTEATKKTLSLARRAGEIIQKHYSLFSRPSTEEKSRLEFVTQTDTRIHRYLSRELPKIVGLPVLSEESTKRWKPTDSYWVIDPIDGTTNFVTRIPYFCVGIGLVLYNEIVLNAVYNPITRELFHAEKGSGAYLNARRLQADTHLPLSKSIIGVSYSHSQSSIQRAGKIGLRLRRTVHNTRHSGSTLLTFAYVAVGRLEASVVIGPVTPWDSIPALLLIQEVNGKITDLSGKPFVLGKTKSIVASNAADHTHLIQIISSIHS